MANSRQNKKNEAKAGKKLEQAAATPAQGEDAAKPQAAAEASPPRKTGASPKGQTDGQKASAAKKPLSTNKPKEASKPQPKQEKKAVLQSEDGLEPVAAKEEPVEKALAEKPAKTPMVAAPQAEKAPLTAVAPPQPERAAEQPMAAQAPAVVPAASQAATESAETVAKKPFGWAMGLLPKRRVAKEISPATAQQPEAEPVARPAAPAMDLVPPAPAKEAPAEEQVAGSPVQKAFGWAMALLPKRQEGRTAPRETGAEQPLPEVRPEAPVMELVPPAAASGPAAKVKKSFAKKAFGWAAGLLPGREEEQPEEQEAPALEKADGRAEGIPAVGAEQPVVAASAAATEQPAAVSEPEKEEPAVEAEPPAAETETAAEKARRIAAVVESTAEIKAVAPEAAAPEGEAPKGTEETPGEGTEETKVFSTADGKPELQVRKGTGQGRRRRKKSVAVRMLVGVLKLVFVLGCFVVIAGSIAAVSMVDYMVEATADDDTLLDLETIELNQTSYFMALNSENPGAEEDDDWVIYQELVGPEHRIWVSGDQIPEDLVNAVIAIEDREFYSHNGVNLQRTVYAFANEFLDLTDSQFGASTIEQQLVKNITDDRASEGESGYQRKMREMYRAWTLDRRYTKDMIMEAYLNTIALSGNIGGVQAGANDYFDKDVSELTLAECAMIAGITRAPGAYDPYVNPDNCLYRRNSVLAQMLEIEMITQAEYDAAVAKPLGLARKSSRSQQEVGGTVFSYFSDQVFEEVVRDLSEQLGKTREEAITYLYTKGLRVYTTVDLDVQGPLEDMYATGYDEDGFFTNMQDSRTGRMYKDRLTVKEEDDEGNVTEVLPQSSCVIIDYDGALKAVVGGIGEKTESRVLNRATQSPRQVGSTMKPIAAYALGIDMGYIDYSSSIVDSGVQYSNGATTGPVDPETGEARYNWPRNFSGTYRYTGMPVVSAVAESTNTVAVKVGMRVGVAEMYDFLVNTLDITSLTSDGPNNTTDVALAPLVLGSMTYGITPYELAGAYMMFGNGGVHNTLHSYSEVRDAHGNVVVKPKVSTVQAISEESAYVMNRLLYAVTHNGVAPGVAATGAGAAPEGDLDCIGKTGTTSEDRDRWFVGMTPYYVTTVWWGYDDNYELTWGTGARNNLTSRVFKSIMETVQEDLPYKEFPEKPDTVEVAAYCTATGELAGPNCPGRSTGYYTPVRTPSTCTLHSGIPSE